MATACVKLIESGGELSNIIIDNLDDPVKVAVKDGDKYTVKESNDMTGADFKENHLFVHIDATPAATPSAEEKQVDPNATSAATPSAEEKQVDPSEEEEEDPEAAKAAKAAKAAEEEAAKAAKAAEEEIVDPIPSYEENIQNMSGRLKRGGKSSRKGRKYTRKGRKYTRKGRKSSKNGGKTAKRGRNGKGSRRSKK